MSGRRSVLRLKSLWSTLLQSLPQDVPSFLRHLSAVHPIRDGLVPASPTVFATDHPGSGSPHPKQGCVPRSSGTSDNTQHSIAAVQDVQDDEVALSRIVDPMIECHKQFLAKLEEQLELQGGLVKQMVDLQEQILRKLE